MMNETREQRQARLQVELDDLTERLDTARRRMSAAEDEGNGPGYRRLRDERERLEADEELLSKRLNDLLFNDECERRERRPPTAQVKPFRLPDLKRGGPGGSSAV